MSSKLSLNSRSSSKASYNTSKFSESIILKPQQLAETCPIETTKTQASINAKKPLKKPKSKKKSCSSETLEHWLKPGLSLPKFQTKVPPLRPDAGEPCASYEIPVYKKKSTSSEEITSVSFSNKSEDSCVVPNKITAEISEIYDEAVGPSKCQFLFRVPSEELPRENIQFPEEEIQPSHTLKLWELWMKRRKHIQNYLCKHLERRPCDLLINQGENFRKVFEDKLLFQYAQIPEADKWRGHPYRWKSEVRIKWKGNNKWADEGLDLFGARTKLDKGTVPSMEFIGVPVAIQKEKGLVCVDAPKSVNSTTKFWEESSYRKEKCQDLKKRRRKLMPNHIQMEELAVVGTKLPPKNPEENANLPETKLLPKIQINNTEIKDDDHDVYHIPRVLHSNDSVICLAIMDEEIKIDLNEDEYYMEENMNWDVDFGSNPMGTFVERILKVENRGTMAIHYEWVPKKPEVKQSLNIIKPSAREPWFFFDKNSGIFIPGQIYDMKFYHHSKKAGVRTECWFMKTTPFLFKNPKGGRFLLSAVATSNSFDEGILELDNYLKRRLANSIARSIIKEILHYITQPVYLMHMIEYRSIFEEKELFEYHNPKHYYHSNIVANLREIFKEIPQEIQPEWDLSLNSLIELTTNNTTRSFQNDLLKKVSDCANKLLRPNYLALHKNGKYRMSYHVLCKMANYIEEDYNFVRQCLYQKRSEHKSKSFSDYFDSDNLSSSLSKTEESDEKESNITTTLYNISPINFIYFQTMFYLKTYERLCEAAEQIADIVETKKFFEPWKKVNYAPCRKIK